MYRKTCSIRWARRRVPKQRKLENRKSIVAGGVLGIAFALFWLLAAEPWETPADGEYYLAIYEGQLVAAPWGYRILTPFLARLLPWSVEINFAVVTVVSLVAISSVLAWYTASLNKTFSQAVILCVLWGASFPFVYYGTTFVRADAPMLLLLALLFALSRRFAHPIVLLTLLCLGILAHETILIFLVAIWMDKLLSGTLTGGIRYGSWQLLALTIAAVGFFLGTRYFIAVLPSDAINYVSAPQEMFANVLRASGGWVKHILRIYAAYGPALLFCCWFVVFHLSRRDAFSFTVLSLSAVGLTFLAIDTLRVMTLVFFPVLVYAAAYLQMLRERGEQSKFVACVFLQGVYSWLVYGHLRTFEASSTMNVLAALLSLTALAICAWPLDISLLRRGRPSAPQ